MILVSETRVVNAELIQDRGVHVVYVNPVLHHAVTEFVGLAVSKPGYVAGIVHGLAVESGDRASPLRARSR